MSKVAIIEAVYDGMMGRGLNPDHEAFEDILNACAAMAEAEKSGGTDVLAWAAEQERTHQLDSLFSEDRVQARSAVQIYLDWRTYLDKCSKKSMKLAALLTALVEEGAAYAH